MSYLTAANFNSSCIDSSCELSFCCIPLNKSTISKLLFDVAEKTIRKVIDIVSRRNRAKLAVNISETDFEKSCAPLLADARRAYVTSWDRVELVLGPRRLPGGSSV